MKRFAKRLIKKVGNSYNPDHGDREFIADPRRQKVRGDDSPGPTE
jgi:hypothetical protein